MARGQLTGVRPDGEARPVKRSASALPASHPGAQAASANGELVSAHVIPRPERDVLETFLK